MRSFLVAVNRWCGIRLGLRLMATAHCTIDQAYERAVTALNSLQTNAAVLEEIRRRGDRQPCTENAKMHQYLLRAGLIEEDLNQLHAIHVAGTKGKGSVCALCESVLRSHGLKTGFYSSPHLLEVRERIRINGRPLSKAAFVSYFWSVFDKLNNSKQNYGNSMPAYFRFLTVMAFSVFLQEKVDVAVVEVGIGGTHDSTNIIPQPVVCAISSLGYDHMDILGTSLSQIAWQKGGICKSGRPALTLPQPPEAMEALVKRAQELQVSSFQVVPPLSSYPGPHPELSLRGKHQSYNVSLAVQVCRTWLEATGRTKASTATPLLESGVSVAEPFHLPDQFKHGLQHCVWAGRNQVVRRGSIAYYLDGAHTPQSIEASAEWFLTETAPEDTVRELPVRILLFNITGRREPQKFLPFLLACQFQYALFCPNVVTTVDGNSADQTNLTVTADHQMARCFANEKIFQDLVRSSSSSQEERSAVETKVFPCISHAIQWVESLCPTPQSNQSPTPSYSSSSPSHSPPPHGPHGPHVAMLVTGSLHLVGAVMHMLGFTIDDV